MAKEFTLSRPIRAHGDDRTTLTLAEPTGKDVREIGLPYKMGADEAIVFDMDKVARYIVRLAGIPMSSVDAMSPADLTRLALEITGFFSASEPVPTN